MMQPNMDQKHLKKKYIVADVYYGVRSKMILSVLNMYRILWLVIIL